MGEYLLDEVLPVERQQSLFEAAAVAVEHKYNQKEAGFVKSMYPGLELDVEL